MPDINQILKQKCYNASSSRGSAMGRRNQRSGDPALDGPLYIQRLEMVDGDYDVGGAYWGGWSHERGGMWCGFTDPKVTQSDEIVMVFVRAKTVQEAQELIDNELVEDGWSFSL